MKWLRSLYDWVLHWAETPYAVPALFLLALVESSIFPIPPDILLMAMALSVSKRALYFALICSVGSVIGGAIGYGIGWGLWAELSDFFFAYIPGFTQDKFTHVQGWYEQYNFWIVFAAGFTPIPYKVITITAGVFNINFPIFILASVISRSARFFIIAFLIYRFGPSIKSFIDKYFNWLSLAFLVLLIGFYFVFKLIK